MPGQLFHLADRLLNQSLLIHPAKAQILLSVLAGRIGVDAMSPEFLPGEPEASRFVGSARRDNGRSALTRADGGVAIVPVLDSLVNRGAWLDSRSGLTSYEGIAAQIRDAADDPDVHSILLDISSPGGEASGMASLAALIRSVRQTKPVVAFVNDMAASAAYGIASAANEIVISPTSMLGSIGVVMLHADRSGEFAEAGVKPTLIFAGSHKVDGNPFEPLSDSVRAELQASVDAYYEQFLEVVAAGRGTRLSADMARATQARTFIGSNAIAQGLADRTASLEEVLSQMSQSSPAGGKDQRGISMSKTDDMQTKEPDGFTQAQLEQASNTACMEERARIRAIVRCQAAQGRMAQALMLATETSLSAEEAEKLLSASPKESSIEALANRAANGSEIGAASDQVFVPDAGERAANGWKKAIAAANERFLQG